jgi:hypothetical protein
MWGNTSSGFIARPNYFVSSVVYRQEVGVMNSLAKPSMVRDTKVEIEKINNPALSVMEQTGKSYLNKQN